MSPLGLPAGRSAAAVLAAVLLLSTTPTRPATAQDADANRPAEPEGLAAQTLPQLPPVPPRGAWGEVIMANPKWVVVQNHLGQQFPIAAESIGQFLIRWPSSPGALTNQSWVEVIGQGLPNNIVRTDHVDVFEGTDRTLVAPTYNAAIPTDDALGTAIDPNINRFMFGFDMLFMNVAYGWAYPMPTATMNMPSRLHVVGAAVANDPIQIGLPGNFPLTVLPINMAGITVTQVTRGNTSFAEKGDLVFLMPTDLAPRSVILSQLVLYKKKPLREFMGR